GRLLEHPLGVQHEQQRAGAPSTGVLQRAAGADLTRHLAAAVSQNLLGGGQELIELSARMPLDSDAAHDPLPQPRATRIQHTAEFALAVAFADLQRAVE